MDLEATVYISEIYETSVRCSDPASHYSSINRPTSISFSVLTGPRSLTAEGATEKAGRAHSSTQNWRTRRSTTNSNRSNWNATGFVPGSGLTPLRHENARPDRRCPAGAPTYRGTIKCGMLVGSVSSPASALSPMALNTGDYSDLNALMMHSDNAICEIGRRLDQQHAGKSVARFPAAWINQHELDHFGSRSARHTA
jgi:hypothetical protein